MSVTSNIFLGDCVKVMKDFESNSIDAIITDPPYGLSAARNSGKKSKGGFMGKAWDYDVPKVEVWAECLRVLKPGGHLLSFAGTRTQHRMCCNIEDAGFEIRDMIAWVYSTGFPKSLNISKKIDQMAFHEWLTAHPVEHAKYKEQIKQAKGNHELTERVGRKFRKMAGVEREVVGVDPEAKRRNKGPMLPADKGWNANSMGNGKLCPITSPATPAAKQWDGWGTSLKPSVEIWTLAQKSLTSGSECGIILENIIANFKEILCQYQLFVEIAEKHFKSSPSEFSGVVSIAQWIAGENTSTRGDLFALMVTLQSGSETNSSWNTVLSWLNTLAALCETMNTHTTSMVSSLTIDLKILESLEWENIFQSIIPANDNQTNGWNAPVLNAVSIFNVLELKLKNILKHFVPENAFHHQNGTSAKNVGQDLPQTTQKENTALLNVTTQPTEGTNEKELKKSASSAEKSLKQSHVETQNTAESNVCQKHIGKLSPNLSLITLARKPISEPTIAANVLKWSTGGINVDGCRVGTTKRVPGGISQQKPNANVYGKYGIETGDEPGHNPNIGRFPANLIHDGSDEVVGMFPETASGGGQDRFMKTKGFSSKNTYAQDRWTQEKCKGVMATSPSDSGSASRFFYVAKCSKRDRDEGLEGMEGMEDRENQSLSLRHDKHCKTCGKKIDDLSRDSRPKSRCFCTDQREPYFKAVKAVPRKNTHCCVKPTKLMQYLCRLITPENGTVLDPFMGSGSTGKACVLEGFNFIGIEMEPEYFEIAKKRIEAAKGEFALFDI